MHKTLLALALSLSAQTPRHHASAPALAPAATTTSGGLVFIPVTPCRVADTRASSMLAPAETRTFNIPSSSCNIPATAAAYSLNVTVVPPGVLGYLSIWPAGQTQPIVSTLNSDGRVKANAAIVAAGANGGVSVYVSHPTHVIIDINGYFAAEGTPGGLEFFALTPCRIADTRNTNGAFGGPYLTGGVARTYPIRSSGCSVPANAQAYSLNITAIPHQPIGFLAAWPAGQQQPGVSTLNTSSLDVTANAAILAAGTGGGVTIYSSHDTDLVVDINGYFAPSASTGLELYTLSPCRIVDTRFTSTGVPVNGVLAVPATTGTCTVPPNAQGTVLNATVVPTSSLGFLTLWPDSISRPWVSTLNASDEAVTSNMAIVPLADSVVDVYSSSATHVILDVSGYFAPGSTQPSASIALSPNSVSLGSTATLSWSVTNATSCTASGAWSGTVATTGSQTVTPSATGSYQYNLSCTGTGGTVTQTAVLTVNPAGAGLAIHVSGNQLVDSTGHTLQLRGVDVSALEATAIQGWATLPNGGYNNWGDAGLGNEPPWQLIHTSWYSNVVRLPLNEASWLGYTCSNLDGSTQNPDPGHNYQTTVQQSVADANAAGMYVILDLHWSAPKALVNGSTVDICPQTQNPMADADHSVAFWTSVANTFKGNPSVMFELFNEPFFYWLSSGENEWNVLLNGGVVTEYVADSKNPITNQATTVTVTANWHATGIQQMLNAVRSTGAQNVVLVSGTNWNSDLSGLANHMPTDPMNQMAVAWHPYPSSSAPTQPSSGVIQYTYAQQLSNVYPFIITETGDPNTPGTVGSPFVSIVLPWADSLGISYLGWTWDPWANTSDVLIKDASGTPTDGYGQYFRAHLACRAAGTVSCP